MQRLWLLFFILATRFNVTGQSKQEKENAYNKEVYACTYRYKISVEERLTNYPFNEAKKIEVISFANDSSELFFIPAKKDTLDLSQSTQTITLTKDQIDSLTDLVFNIGIKGNTYTMNVSTAVGLDAAILFRNGDGDIFEYIELCFGCGDMSIKLVKMRATIGVPCNEKMEMLKAFFMKEGLNFKAYN